MKPKICGICFKEVPALWKAKRKLQDGTILPGKCKSCANKPQVGDILKPKGQGNFKPTHRIISITPIHKLSEKEKKRQAAYSVLKKQYMVHHPECQVRLPECNRIAIDIHHLYFGADRYAHFLDSTSWKSTCRSCHNTIHNKLSNEELLLKGLRLKE